MTERMRRGLATLVLLAAVLAIEAVGLRSGKLGLFLVILVILLAAAVLAVGVDLQRLAIGAALLGAFTITWNGIFLGPVRPGDVLVILAFMLFVLANPNHGLVTPPWWVKQLGGVIALIAIIQIFFPPDPIFLSRRILLASTGKLLGAGDVVTSGIILTNIVVALKFIVGVVFIPMVFSAATLLDKRALKWIVVAFTAGSALGGWVATADYLVGTSIGRLVTGIPNGGGRQFGFSNHPNYLAAGLVLAVPLAIWLASSYERRDRLIGWAALPGLVGGVYASGSRGGTVCVVLGVAMSVVLIPRIRPFAPSIFAGGALLLGVVVAFTPSLGAEILRVTRLSGGIATAGSNAVRQAQADQGIRDWHHSPIWGIGYQISDQASQVYLQELATGGLILFTGMLLYSLGGMIDAWALRERYSLALALLASILTALALNFVEADLTDRFYYVPPGILAALIVWHRLYGDDPPDTVDDEDGDEQAAAEPGPARARAVEARR